MISEEKSVSGGKGRISRRKFLTGTSATTAAFTIVPRYVLGGAGYTPPSEMLNVAGVGVGGIRCIKR